jgi:hypothetical protein
MKSRSQFKVWMTKFSNEIEILVLKSSIIKFKISMESIINRPDQVEERMSGIEDKVEE